MIFEQAEFRIGGDRSLLMMLGDEMSFDLNFKVHSLARSIRESRTRGIIELIPEMASLLVSYDPDLISYEDLTSELAAMHQAMSHSEIDELPSRMFYVPVLYFDPWTRACVDDYRAKIKDKPWDGDLLVVMNGLEDISALRRIHASTEYWVAALGFWPGLCSLLPLDPRSRLTAPKYDPPRTWTPKGTIGLGGAITCIYPDQTPGGYQIFARIPMPIWDRSQRLEAFKESLACFAQAIGCASSPSPPKNMRTSSAKSRTAAISTRRSPTSAFPAGSIAIGWPASTPQPASDPSAL
jgi:urea carboxylase